MHEEFSSSYLDRFNSCHFRVYSTSGEESIPWTFRLHHPENTDHDFAADSRKKMKVLTTFITTVASLLHWGLRPYRSKGWESEISESLSFLSPLHPFSQLLCLCSSRILCPWQQNEVQCFRVINLFFAIKYCDGTSTPDSICTDEEWP